MHRRDRDRQGDDGSRSGRRRRARQDPGRRRHRGRQGQRADRAAARGGRGRAPRCAKAAAPPRRSRPRRGRRRSRPAGGAGTGRRRPQPRRRAAPAAARAGRTAPQRATRVFASPLAKRMARAGRARLGAHHTAAARTAASSRPTSRRRSAAASRRRAPQPQPPRAPRRAGAAPQPADRAGGAAPLQARAAHRRMRKVIARRLTESKQTVPHFYLTVDCEIDALLKLRADINAQRRRRAGRVQALGQRSRHQGRGAGAAARAGRQRLMDRRGDPAVRDVDISVAVAIPDGLITPIIRDADQKGLAADLRRDEGPGRRAPSDGKLKPEEFQGGTLLDLQPRHVRHQRVRRDHQPAAGLHPGGRRRRAARRRARTARWPSRR